MRCSVGSLRISTEAPISTTLTATSSTAKRTEFEL
jgi:hypothetical protein